MVNAVQTIPRGPYIRRAITGVLRMPNDVQAAIRNTPKPEALYAKLEDRILARDQKGASDVYYDLVRERRPVKPAIPIAVAKAEMAAEMAEMMRLGAGHRRQPANCRRHQRRREPSHRPVHPALPHWFPCRRQ